MPRNRTAELDQRLDELEATVRGLTEELVEAHGRIAELESQLGEDGSTDTTKHTTARENEDQSPATGENPRDREDPEETGEESDLDDIIVA